jgi:transposase
MAKRKKYSAELKIEILKRYDRGEKLIDLAEEYDVKISTLHRWKNEYIIYTDEAFQGNGHTYKNDAKTSELERKIGQLTLENELLKKKLKALNEEKKLMKELGELG